MRDERGIVLSHTCQHVLACLLPEGALRTEARYVREARVAVGPSCLIGHLVSSGWRSGRPTKRWQHARRYRHQKTCIPESDNLSLHTGLGYVPAEGAGPKAGAYQKQTCSPADASLAHGRAASCGIRRLTTPLLPPCRPLLAPRARRWILREGAGVPENLRHTGGTEAKPATALTTAGRRRHV